MNQPYAFWKGYPIWISDKPEKKYYALVTFVKSGKPLKIYFGDTSYQHYRDKLGYWSHLDHGYATRRASYKSRHGSTRHTRGTASWFADQILW